MSPHAELYAIWREKLSALVRENDKHDFSPEGDARYQTALAEAKAAYYRLHEVEAGENASQ